MNQNKKIAVTIITGFLGAGKTTFINALLKANRNKHFALVENEFGEVSIDTKLIKGVDASQMFELREGCICCTISDEYELVLQELAERFPNVEHLLIETTGVANPAQVVRPFFREEDLQKMYSFNGIICLVDALNFENETESELKNKQVAIADLVLISKTEKLISDEKERLKSQVRRINPLCETQYAENGITEWNKLDNLSSRIKYFPEIKTNHSEITSRTLTFKKPLNKEKFISWLSYNLDVYKNEIYRVKGILCFENEPYESILQGLGGSFELTEGENLISDNKCEIVFIGKLNGLNIEF